MKSLSSNYPQEISDIHMKGLMCLFTYPQLLGKEVEDLQSYVTSLKDM